MSPPAFAPSEDDLSAFINGELHEDRHNEVEAVVAVTPELAARVAAMRRQDDALKRLAETILDEPVPERLTSVLRSAASQAKAAERPAVRRRALPLPWQFGAMAASLVVGVGVGWYGQMVLAEKGSLLEPFVEQAVLSHRLFESDKQFEPVETRGDMISIDAGGKPFRLPVRTPALSGSDLVPVMVRKHEGISGDAIHIAYEDKAGDWTTLYIRKHSDDAQLPVKFEEREGYSVLYWLDGPLLYALVGSGDAEKLRAMAEDVYRSKAISELEPGKPEQEIKPAVAR